MIHVSFCVRSKHPNLFMRGHNVRNSRTPQFCCWLKCCPQAHVIPYHAPHRDFKGEPWLHCEVVSLRLSRLAQIAPLPAIGGSSIRSWDVEDINDLTTSKSRFTLVATNPNHPNPKNLNSAPDKKPYETEVWPILSSWNFEMNGAMGRASKTGRKASRQKMACDWSATAELHASLEARHFPLWMP